MSSRTGSLVLFPHLTQAPRAHTEQPQGQTLLCLAHNEDPALSPQRPVKMPSEGPTLVPRALHQL